MKKECTYCSGKAEYRVESAELLTMLYLCDFCSANYVQVDPKARVYNINDYKALKPVYFVPMDDLIKEALTMAKLDAHIRKSKSKKPFMKSAIALSNFATHIERRDNE